MKIINKKQNIKKQNVQSAPLESTDIPKHAKATVFRLLGRLSRQKGKLILILLTALLSCVTFAAVPLVVGAAIDNLMEGIKTFQGTNGVFDMVSRALALPIFLIILISAVSSLMSYIQQYIVASVGEELTLSLRQDISEKITKLPLRYFDTHKTGDLLSRITNDLEKVSEVMQVGLMQFITSVITIVVTIAAMLLLHPVLTVTVLVTVGISTFATKIVSKKCETYFAANQEAMGALNSRVEELYAGNLILKVFNQQEDAIASVVELNEKHYRTFRRAQFAVYAIYPAIRLLNQLGFVVTAIVGGFLVLKGSLSVGAMQAFLQYVNQISEPVTQAAYVINSLQAAVAGAERVFAVLDEEEEIPDEMTEQELKSVTGQVNFQNVQFGYTPESPLMKNISLEVRPNEMVAIVGPTGGGKTTLINLLMRFYELDGGSISIDGTDVRQISRGTLRRRIGMVLQDTWLFEGTIAENIAYGKRDASRDEIEEAARAARCDHFIRTLPLGYETMISSEAASLSQGQMQLLTIARAMLTNPSIMILDEATSSVDTRTEVEIQMAMNHMMRDKTSFVIAHRLSTIKNADLILVVRDGDIVESGTHAGLLKQKGFYASLYQSQFGNAA